MSHRDLALPVLLSCAIAGSGCDRAGSVRSVRLADAGTAPPGFVLLSPDLTGVDFENRLESEHVKKYLYNGAGVAIGDYDGDGLPDVFLVCQDGADRLYRNAGGMRFENVTVHAGVLDGTDWGSGASFADVDGDGDLDLYVANTGTPDHLYVNGGDGTYAERGREAGLGHTGAGTQPTFADYDRDGDLDLYLVTNRVFSAAEDAPRLKARRYADRLVVHSDHAEQASVLDGRIIEAGQPDVLYRNEGDGTFTDVSAMAGIAGNDMGLSATWWDFDENGWPDLYVANDLKTPDHLYRNEGDGTFTDVLAETVPYTSWFSMGSDHGDVDGDGHLDLIVGDMAPRSHVEQKVNMGDMFESGWFLDVARPRQYMRNTLFLGTGTPRLLEAAYVAGLATTDWTWTLRLCDLDCDGRLDVYITTGMERNVNDADWNAGVERLLAEGRREEATALLAEIPRRAEPNLAYRNLGDLRFEDVSAAWGLDGAGVSQGAAAADLDRDGDLDLVVNDLNAPARVYRNDTGGGHRLLVALEGRQSNRHGVGARLTLESPSGRQVRIVSLARGYLSAEEPIVHFGLGADERATRLTIEWPSSLHQVVENLPAGYLHAIREAGSDFSPAPPPGTLFVNAAEATSLVYEHAERPYDDFARQPLLPMKLSRLGPGLAWGDVNGDGAEDLFVGGAAGESGVLFVRDAAGRFERSAGPWSADAAAEDMGALFFDADIDGDMDLYVVSGGVECAVGEPVLRDRLYRNDGGVFVPTRALPDLRDSGSSVAGADVDRDGDVDLFVGTRSVPGAYPLPATSRLLRNDAGALVDATRTVAGLSPAGLVTGAVFTDVNDDGWIDLVVAREWGAIGLFVNESGRLTDATREAGLDAHSGLWNGVVALDVDRDGDMDLVATNLGHNSRYHASPHDPLELFHHDFDGDGRAEIVEASSEHGRLVPVRGRSCSAEAMPFIAERFPTFRSFGLASLEEIYGADLLAESHRVSARTLGSALFVNDGFGRFKMRPLPWPAQLAPGYGAVATELDGDGWTDVVFAQNSFSPQRETGVLSGGLGLLMLGREDGGLTPCGAAESGIVIPGDAKAATYCHLDADGWPDLVVATNAGPLFVLRNAAGERAERRVLTVFLAGEPGNPTGAGARVTLDVEGGDPRVAEITAGSGYLSQGSAAVTFGLGTGETPVSLLVRWPDGTESTHVDLAGPIVRVRRESP